MDSAGELICNMFPCPHWFKWAWGRHGFYTNHQITIFEIKSFWTPDEAIAVNVGRFLLCLSEHYMAEFEGFVLLWSQDT